MLGAYIPTYLNLILSLPYCYYHSWINVCEQNGREGVGRRWPPLNWTLQLVKFN